MNTLIKEIENTIEAAVASFVQRIAEKYDIEVDELMELWAYGGETNTTTSRVVQKKVTPNKSNVCKLPLSPNVTPTKSESIPTESEDGCPYLFTKGAQEGKKCGKNPKSGATYCSRHKKYEGIEPKQKKILPISKKKSVAATVKSNKLPVNNTIHKVLRKNKALDKLWHVETGMVFKSARDRIVIGKCVDNELHPLTSEDIQVCIARSFKYEEPEEEPEEVVDEEPEEVVDEEPEEVVDEEEELDEVAEAVASKAVHKITAVPRNISAKNPTHPRKDVPNKSSKTLTGSKAKSVKKSISVAIEGTNIQAADIEEILGELQTSHDHEEIFDEIFEEEYGEATDDGEEYEEEFLEEEE